MRFANKTKAIMKKNIVISSMLLFAIICMSSVCNNANGTKSKQQTSAMENQTNKNPYYSRTDTTKLNVSNAEWKKVLSEDMYYVAREKGTERAFTGKYWETDELGTYYCAVCGNRLFVSDSKFASSCGWPSFFEAVRKDAVEYHEDKSYGMTRTEVTCGRCESHLGHIFDDGPPPTGMRFCMNSIVLDFDPKK